MEREDHFGIRVALLPPRTVAPASRLAGCGAGLRGGHGGNIAYSSWSRGWRARHMDHWLSSARFRSARRLQPPGHNRGCSGTIHVTDPRREATRFGFTIGLGHADLRTRTGGQDGQERRSVLVGAHYQYQRIGPDRPRRISRLLRNEPRHSQPVGRRADGGRHRLCRTGFGDRDVVLRGRRLYEHGAREHSLERREQDDYLTPKKKVPEPLSQPRHDYISIRE